MKKHMWPKFPLIAIILMLIAALLGCQQKPKHQLILFLENEEGVDPYQTRIMITPDYLRFDDGEQSVSFLLVDRHKKIAYSVNHEMKSIMRVEQKDIKATSPMELTYTVKELDDFNDAPKIENIQPKHRQLLTNDEVCLDVISVDGLMPEAVAALKEYHMLLASDSAVTFNTIPADMHDPCNISMSTFAPTRHLDYGFPIQEWKPGYARSLESYKDDYQVAPELLKLPGDYFNYSITEFREGRVDFNNRKVLTDAELKAEVVNTEAGQSGSEVTNSDSAAQVEDTAPETAPKVQ